MTKPSPQPPQSPFVYEATDYAGNVIRITVPFDTTTGTVQSATVYRDAACVYTMIYIGVGPDGTPNTSPYKVQVPAGTTSFTGAQMAAIGLGAISTVRGLQITAGT